MLASLECNQSNCSRIWHWCAFFGSIQNVSLCRCDSKNMNTSNQVDPTTFNSLLQSVQTNSQS